MHPYFTDAKVWKKMHVLDSGQSDSTYYSTIVASKKTNIVKKNL